MWNMNKQFQQTMPMPQQSYAMNAPSPMSETTPSSQTQQAYMRNPGMNE